MMYGLKCLVATGLYDVRTECLVATGLNDVRTDVFSCYGNCQCFNLTRTRDVLVALR